MRTSGRTNKDIKYLVGIDEVGRGPLAGPITICAFCIPKNFNRSLFKGVNSSKKLTTLKRLNWEKILKDLVKKGKVKCAISSVRPSLIDRDGLTKTTNLAISRALKRLEVDPLNAFIFLDGSLKAPTQYLFQRTVIKGDEKVKIISCASVLAKGRRDRYMVKAAKVFPQYSFDEHKGYGTKLHKKLIKKHGLSRIHRKSFLRKIRDRRFIHKSVDFSLI
jgi:ribonuclease HII